MPVMFFKLFSVDSTEITPSKVEYYMDYYISKIEEILITALAIPKRPKHTVWDRVPKEDAANFESDTFL